MARTPDVDLAAAHRYFSVHCFNAAWDLIDKADRTAEDDRLMEALSQASIWHWRQRPDCDDRRLSIGYWQASRIQALLGHASEAVRWGEVCLARSHGLEPFYAGYAHEALARAHALAGRAAAVSRHLALARELAQQVKASEDRALLVKDLESLA